MPYFTITDFAAGLDLRRSSLTAPAGTLRSLRNGHITPGGEIEKRMAFVKVKTVDPNTKGLVSVNQKLYVFGPNGPGVVEPTGIWDVGTLKLETPTVFEIVDYDLFDNKVFAVAWIDGAGNTKRFYDGANVPAANGFYVRTYKTKMYSVGGSVLYFSAVGNPADWTGTGSGSIDLSLEDSDMTDCTALEVYYDKLAVLSKTATQLWQIDPDPLKNQYVQTLRDAGTVAWRSVLQYGSGDVMYVAPSGIRSLRARNASLAAAVSDIGSPLDPVIQQLFRSLGEDWMSGTMSFLQPVTGRFWVVLPDRIYILSAFPGPKITAWSQYEPGFNITAAAVYQHRIMVRDDQNNIYAYGGTDGLTYDDCPVEVIFPFHAGDQPATNKRYTGINAACQGQWEVSAGFNPIDDSAEDYLGLLDGPNFVGGKFPMYGESTHMSLRLRCFSDGPASISNMIVHYDLGATV
ncbi:hypothetical protein QIH85_24065 [Bradyrhizobium japonicum]|uniref:hypothetical protein n=1 Tax=Bradyrhizobium japonicum TaxID=375 RepID=UPI002714E3A8|nr:hypothetical protein [Bradyrhizobium japonicum]WLB24960.1 hypothetical protein QIH85_24065 [Bradyrhizobium japonicum]